MYEHEGVTQGIFFACTVAGVLDKLTQLSKLSGVAIPGRQAAQDGHGSSLCRLVGLYVYSAERG